MTNTTIPVSLDAFAIGRSSSNPFVDQFEPRDPEVTDIQYPIQKKWLNTSDGSFWELQNFNTVNGVTTANWVLIGSHGFVTESLTGNDGIPVFPIFNNINVVGDGTYIKTAGDPATATLTIEPAGGIATVYTEDTGTATPSSGNLNVFGGTAINTAGATDTITINANIAQAAASSVLSNAGVASFNSTEFTVDANGFVSLEGGAPGTVKGNEVDTFTGPGTNPVLPNGSGIITVTGGQVAAGTTVNVIRTDSLAANTYTIEVQRSQAVASSTVGDNGVCHFNSSQFSVDANGFVSIGESKFPAFFAYLNTTVDNVTGDETTYTVIMDTVTFDNLGNYSTVTGQFTAPITGFYTFATAISCGNINSSMLQATLDLLYNETTYIHGNSGGAFAMAGPNGTFTLLGTVIYYMNQGDTMQPTIGVGSNTKTVDVLGTSSVMYAQPTHFSCALVF